MNQENTSIYNVSFENGKLRKWIHKGRRVGRPRMNWTEETIKEIWDLIRIGHEEDRFKAFNPEDDYIINKIHDYAGNDKIKFTTPQTNNNSNTQQPDTTTNLTTPIQPTDDTEAKAKAKANAKQN